MTFVRPGGRHSFYRAAGAGRAGIGDGLSHAPCQKKTQEDVKRALGTLETRHLRASGSIPGNEPCRAASGRQGFSYPSANCSKA